MTNISTFPGDTQGRNILKSRTITHGNSSSGEVDTYTLNPGENLIILNNHQGSAGSSRTYAANFTAGIPTALGTVLHLEINSSRTNTSGSQVLHRTAIQFGGTAYLDTGNIGCLAAGNALDAYQRKLQRTIVLTVSGWVDFSLGSRVGGDTLATDIIFQTNTNASKSATGSDTADVERMRITNLGLVGIGTNAPSELLDLKPTSGDHGIIRLRTIAGDTGESGLKLTEDSDYGFQFVHSAVSDLLKVKHQNGSGAVDKDNMMVFNPNGNVGIGTASMDHLLDVYGTVDSLGYGSPGGGTFYMNNNSVRTVYSMSSGDSGLLYCYGSWNAYGLAYFQWKTGVTTASCNILVNSGFAAFQTDGNTNIWLKQTTGSAQHGYVKIIKFRPH